MKKKLLLLLCCVAFWSTRASHFSGGELRYEFNGTNYDVYLSLYKICEGGAPLPSSAAINLASVSQSVNNTINLQFLGFDTVNIHCPGATNRCVNPASIIPGYITAYFKGTITLPAQANDWVLSYTNAARIASLVNLTSQSSNGTMYLFTNLDNSAAINSNPLIANSPSYYMVSGANNVIPLQAVDAEGDNLVFDFVTPQTTNGANITYNTGYSVTAPFGTGGTASINTTNNTMTLNAPSTGSYALALRVREYRNSVLVGTYIREFTVTVLPSTSGPATVPAPATNTVFSYYTCPGQSNSITLSFTDPTSTDSVYLDIIPPTLTGWTFNSTTTSGTPTATTTITWNTPSGMNPATLPHFYITIRARDNGCPRASADYAVVIRTRQCNADSVWPGDANGDFTVNIYDPLAIAIASGQTGPTRPGATTTWSAQACSNWTGVFVTNNTNMKHADCNGDGTVNNTDLAAVTANYSLSHPKGAMNKSTGTNDLYLDFTGIQLAKGSNVSIPIKLGSSTQTVSDVYGLAAGIIINGLNLATAPAIDNAGSWLAGSANAVNFIKELNPTAIEWALARTDQQNTSGNGTIGMLNFTVPQDAQVGSTVTFNFSNPVMVDNKGMMIYDVNTTVQTAQVAPPQAVGSIDNNMQSVAVVPNPSGNTAHVNLHLRTQTGVSVQVTDVTGKLVWTENGQYGVGNHQIALPASNLNPGIYFIRVNTPSNGYESVLKWVKQ